MWTRTRRITKLPQLKLGGADVRIMLKMVDLLHGYILVHARQMWTTQSESQWPTTYLIVNGERADMLGSDSYRTFDIR